MNFKLIKEKFHSLAEFYDEHAKQILTAVTGISLAFAVGMCTSNINKKDTDLPIETAIETPTTDTFEYIPREEAEKPSETEEPELEPEIISEQETDSIINDYLEDLKSGFNELKGYAKDKWNSEEVQTKLETYKAKLKTLLNFIFNGGEIYGITFSDLGAEAKSNVISSVKELDGWIEYLFPEYKDRVYNWLVDVGATFVELWNDIKDIWNSYKGDVMDVYNSINGASYTLQKTKLK